MNTSIEQLIAYEEQKKKEKQAEEALQRDYLQVPYEEIKPEIEREKLQEQESSCHIIITNM